jgi:hypothetical protein
LVVRAGDGSAKRARGTSNGQVGSELALVGRNHGLDFARGGIYVVEGEFELLREGLVAVDGQGISRKQELDIG